MTRPTMGLAAIACVVVLGGCSTQPVMVREAEARHRTAVLQARLAEASDASNRAVLADTDAASASAAEEARQGWAAVRDEAAALQGLLDGLGYAPEAALLRDFSQAFGAYVDTDRTILQLAVENSNIKAQRLAFGPASEAADRLVADLEAVRRLDPAPGTRALIAEAALAVREIQALQAPHNAEPGDAEMTRLEARMDAAAQRASRTLAALRTSASPAARSPLEQADAEWSAFISLNQQFVALSRANTNVRSLALSQTDKGRHLEACDRALTALASALEQRGTRGTR